MRQQKGFVLPLTIGLFLILVIIGLVLIRTSGTEEMLARATIDSSEAFWLAEAAVERAFFLLRSTPDWEDDSLLPSPLFYNESIEGYSGTYSLYLSNRTPNSITLRGVGNVKGRIKQIVVELVRERDLSALDYVLFTTKDLTAQGRPRVTGSIGANGEIRGNFRGENTLYPKLGISLPPLNREYFISLAKENKLNGHSGPTGNYFQGGSPSFSSLNGVIFVDQSPDGTPANLKITGNVSTTGNNTCTLIVVGSLTILGNVNFRGLIYTLGPEGSETEIGGSVVIEGSVISDTPLLLHGGGGLNITYERDYLYTNTNLGGLSSLIINSWKEGEE